MHNKQDIIYAAGFFDGEGCITAGPKTFRITVTNTNKEVLDWLCHAFGGNVNQSWGNKKINPKHNKAWKLVITRKPVVVAFLSQIYPYLKIKQREAKVCLNYLNQYPETKPGPKSGKSKEWMQQWNRDYLIAKATIFNLKTDGHYKRDAQCSNLCFNAPTH